MPKNKINLSWGMNEPIESRPSSNYSHAQHHNIPTDTVPATFIHENEPANHNAKVLTDDTSDD